VLWRGLADLAQKYLHKGSLIYLEGRIRTRSWEDKEKNKRFITEIIGDNLVMLDKRKEQTENNNNEGNNVDATGFPDINFDSNSPGNIISKDDMPF
jgi:single-strand DNA-binding protein